MEQIMGITMETLQATTGLEPTTKLLQQAHHKTEFLTQQVRSNNPYKIYMVGRLIHFLSQPMTISIQLCNMLMKDKV